MHASNPTVGAETIRILIVEDQRAVRKGLRMRLDAEADLTVVGEAVDCESALDLAVSLCPDIVLMDVADYRELPYFFGINHCVVTVKKGNIVINRLEQP